MKVSIPELEKLGKNITTSDSLIMLICLLEYKVHHLRDGKTENTIDDIDCIAMQMASKILKSLRTLVSVCTTNFDYASACALLRMVADNISVYTLIYANHDSTELEYRHYLYVLDGLSVRESLMKDEIEDNGHISKEDLQNLKLQYSSTRSSDQLSKDFCINKLNKHIYATEYPQFHKQSISNRNWKFKNKIEVANDKKVKTENQYSWKELYSLLNLNKDIVSFFSSFLSQHIHGLILSNINTNEDQCNFEPIISIAISLLGCIQKDIDSRCPNSNELFTGFMTSKWGYELGGYIDVDYIRNMLKEKAYAIESDNK